MYTRIHPTYIDEYFRNKQLILVKWSISRSFNVKGGYMCLFMHILVVCLRTLCATLILEGGLPTSSFTLKLSVEVPYFAMHPVVSI